MNELDLKMLKVVKLLNINNINYNIYKVENEFRIEFLDKNYNILDKNNVIFRKFDNKISDNLNLKILKRIINGLK